MAEATTSTGLGSLIRLRNLKPSQLPSHPSLSSHGDTSTVSIQEFAARALAEAEVFMTNYLPKKFTVKSTDKRSPPSNSPVELLAKDISSSELPKDSGVPEGVTESWFARKSLHENKAENETASWEEFNYGLRVDHSQHEMDYTPDVVDAHEVMNWDEQLESSGRKVGGSDGSEQWEDVHASIMEMVHKIPAPLNKRVFPVLVITAVKSNPPSPQPGASFLVVQIPVATQGLPGAKYHDVPKVTGGVYCSIERAELVDEGKKTMWQMATASDAKGILPMWAQKMGVPGAVVKDVGLFIQWTGERRKRGKV
jgi:hypothetical protein